MCIGGHAGATQIERLTVRFEREVQEAIGSRYNLNSAVTRAFSQQLFGRLKTITMQPNK